MPREGIQTFGELLDKAREVELLLGENKSVFKVFGSAGRLKCTNSCH